MHCLACALHLQVLDLQLPHISIQQGDAELLVMDVLRRSNIQREPWRDMLGARDAPLEGTLQDKLIGACPPGLSNLLEFVGTNVRGVSHLAAYVSGDTLLQTADLIVGR